MDYSTPGFPVFHYLSAFAQVHVHRVGYAMIKNNNNNNKNHMPIE